MKKILIILLFISQISFGQVLAVIAANNASGVAQQQAYDYYVALSGNDSDGLTPATAWTSLASLQSNIGSLVAGDTVAFQGGDEFFGTLAINALNGALNNEVTFTSYGTGKAVIKGSQSLTNWSDVAFDMQVWQAFVNGVNTGDFVGQVFQNGIPLNNSSSDRVNRFTITSVQSQTQFTSTDLIGEAIGFTTVFLRTRQYAEYVRTITAFDNVTGIVSINSAPNQSMAAGDEFFVINDQVYLTGQLDWYIQSNGDFVFIRNAGSAPTNITAVLGNYTGITVTNSSYLIFDNLSIKDYNLDGINITTSNNISINNSDFIYCYAHGIVSPTGGNSSFININNCNVSNSNERNISSYAINTTVNNSLSEDNALTSNLTYLGIWNPIGIQIAGTESTISNSTVRNMGYNGITFLGINNTIEKNFVKDVSLHLVDGGPIYTFNGEGDFLGTGQTGSVVKDNILIQSDGLVNRGGSIFGIYMDDWSHGVSITNNTTIGAKRGIFLHNTRDMTVTGNVMYDSDESGFSISEDKYDGAIDISTIFTGNDILLQRNNYPNAPIRVTSTQADNYNFFSSLDNNRYYGASNYVTALVQTTATNFINSGFPREFSLSQWQTLIGLDVSSTFGVDHWNNVELGTPTVLVALQDFAGGVGGWGNSGGTVVDGGGFLKYTPSSATSIFYNNSLRFDLVVGDRIYIEFDYKTNTDHNGRVAVIMTGAPNSSLGNRSFSATSTWRTFKQYYTVDLTGVNYRVDFYSNHATAELDIDNWKVDKVTSASDYLTVPLSHIAYNYSSSAQSISIPSGTWQDFDGANYTGTILLQPYRSKILIKQ